MRSLVSAAARGKAVGRIAVTPLETAD